MTPDHNQGCYLGATDVAAHDGKLTMVAQFAQGMIDTCLEFAPERPSMDAQAKCWRIVLDACNECRGIMAHAQAGYNKPCTQEYLDRLSDPEYHRKHRLGEPI